MSHELRTPLNSVIGFTELMLSGKVGPLADAHREYLGDILTSSKHLLQLINDVLDLAKVESGKIEIRAESIDASKLVVEVRDILRGLAGERHTRIEVDVSPDLTGLMLDQAKFKQILYNYLSNAIKFTPDGGLGHRARAAGRRRASAHRRRGHGHRREARGPASAVRRVPAAR